MVTVKEHLEPAGSGPLSTHIPADISTALDNAVTGAAGTDLELDCTVVGGNPAPKLTWYVAGTEVASTLAQEDRKQGNTWTSRSRLRLPVSRADHAGQVRCEAEHDALNTPLIGLATLNILYPPRASAGSSGGNKTSGTSSGLSEGGSVTLTCEVDSNPPASRVSWRRSGAATTLTSQQNFTISPVTRETAGSYECVAENMLGMSQPATVQLHVDCKCFLYLRG